MKFGYLFLVMFCIAVTGHSQSLQINVIGIRNSSGNIRLAFYSNSKSFDEEKPMFIRTVSKKNVSKNNLKVSYNDLKPGIYGIAILDDENVNEKMDYGWFLPKEGFGFSDYYETAMKRPKFDDFDFILTAETKEIVIKVRYL